MENVVFIWCLVTGAPVSGESRGEAYLLHGGACRSATTLGSTLNGVDGVEAALVYMEVFSFSP